MGAIGFFHEVKVPKAATTSEAFRDLRETALYDKGHDNYSGTISEKNSFSEILAKSEKNAKRMRDAMQNHTDLPVYSVGARNGFDDKYGPAVAIRFPLTKDEDGIFFFGAAAY